MSKTTTSNTKILSFLSVALLGLSTNACDSSNSGGTQAPGEGGGSEASSSGSYAELDITLPDLEGDDVTITSQTEKDVHILAFWAVWCTPCQAELTQMMPMWKDLKDRHLNVYAISTDGPDTASRVSATVQKEGWEFPILMDRESEILSRYQPKGDIPFYVILDADGKIMKSHQGYVKGDVDGLRAYLDEVLAPAGE